MDEGCCRINFRNCARFTLVALKSWLIPLSQAPATGILIRFHLLAQSSFGFNFDSNDHPTTGFREEMTLLCLEVGYQMIAAVRIRLTLFHCLL